MSPPLSPYVPRIRGGRGLAGLLALLVVAGYGWLSASTVLPDFGGDAALYWLSAQAWSPWADASPLAEAYARSSTYPPLYPLVLALAGGGASLLAAHQVTVALLLAGLAAVWAFTRRAGLDGLAATGVTMTYALCAIVRLEALDLHSEPLYLLLSMLALAAAVTLRLRPRPATALALGLLVALALLTRSAGAVLWLAVAVVALRERRRVWLLALLPAVIASGLNALLQGSQQRYLGEWLQQYSPSAVLQILQTKAMLLPGQWASGIAGTTPGTGATLALGLFGLTALAAAGWRAWRGHVDGAYALGYVALVILWPYPAETTRLFMPYLCLAIAQVCLAARDIWDCRKTLIWRQLWWFPLLFALGDFAGFVGRMLVPMPQELLPYRRTALWHLSAPQEALHAVGFLSAADAAFARLPQLVPPEACVLNIKPGITAALGHRRAVGPPSFSLSPADFDDALAALGCDYALLMMVPSPSFPARYYPAARLGSRFSPLAEFPNPVNPAQTALILGKILPPAP